MSLKERIYSVLVVSASGKFNSALPALLPESRYSPVQYVGGISAARRLLSDRSFDFIIINSPLNDGTGSSFAADCCERSSSAVLLLIKGELYAEVYDKITSSGSFLLSQPVSKQNMTLALEWMGSTRERLRQHEAESQSFEEKMNEIRSVNRAKWILISQQGMDEPQAHRYIEKQAMDRGISRKDVAMEIIQKK
ncbi:MAG: ANTAR domain-containing protein [Firmicutes bacterium]|nr:ANTAR domain-containing protein [Bacillota bacterium]